jgi:hypothetical protein
MPDEWQSTVHRKLPSRHASRTEKGAFPLVQGAARPCGGGRQPRHFRVGFVRLDRSDSQVLRAGPADPRGLVNGRPPH